RKRFLSSIVFSSRLPTRMSGLRNESRNYRAKKRRKSSATDLPVGIRCGDPRSERAPMLDRAYGSRGSRTAAARRPWWTLESRAHLARRVELPLEDETI